MEEKTSSVPIPKVVAGLVIAAIGFLFLFDNFDLLYIGDIAEWWPLILIILGAGKLTGTIDQRYSGVWLIAIGLWFVVSIQEYWGFDYSNSWPLIVIFSGLMMIAKAFFGRPADTTRNQVINSSGEVHHD